MEGGYQEVNGCLGKEGFEVWGGVGVSELPLLFGLAIEIFVYFCFLMLLLLLLLSLSSHCLRDIRIIRWQD
jgi:hypothetical protein